MEELQITLEEIKNLLNDINDIHVKNNEIDKINTLPISSHNHNVHTPSTKSSSRQQDNESMGP